MEALFLQVYALPDAQPPWFEEQAALVQVIKEVAKVRNGGGRARFTYLFF